MKRVAKIIFISSVLFIVSCFSLYLLVKCSNFEFADSGEKFNNVLLIGIPIAIFATLFRLSYSNNPPWMDTVQITLTVVSGVAFLFFFAFSFFLDMCLDNERAVLFRSKENPNMKIVERAYGCGAVDSTPPIISFCEVTEYPLGLIYVEQIDTAHIDLKKWTRMDSKKPKSNAKK